MIVTNKICSVQKCTKKVTCRDFCQSHYNQWYNGRPLRTPENREYHGMSNEPEYDVWSKMKSRCLNIKDKDYPQWGGRGIEVCDEWVNSFVNFYRDMGKRPTDKHSLDRTNNDGNYEPSNCRWATPSQQQSNKRLYKVNSSGAACVYKVRNKFRVVRRVGGKNVHIGYYATLDTAKEALNSARLA